jgi:hypothetical protein
MRGALSAARSLYGAAKDNRVRLHLGQPLARAARSPRRAALAGGRARCLRPAAAADQRHRAAGPPPSRAAGKTRLHPRSGSARYKINVWNATKWRTERRSQIYYPYSNSSVDEPFAPGYAVQVGLAFSGTTLTFGSAIEEVCCTKDVADAVAVVRARLCAPALRQLAGARRVWPAGSTNYVQGASKLKSSCGVRVDPSLRVSLL